LRDFARSDDPAVQAQLDRLAALSLPQGRFGLETIRALLARLGDPQTRLPPVFHVAGTNGKGSTCAFLRAALEAAGHRVHVYTSPHLVRFNERIRLGGRLINDRYLAELLERALDAGEDLQPSFFEATTAAAFLAFAETPADGCVVEVGLGGRLDATNVIPLPAVCGIASLGIDHEAFLLAPEPGAPEEPIARIAWEKAGIARPGVPLVTLAYEEAADAVIAEHAKRVGAPLFPAFRRWHYGVAHGRVQYRDHAALMAPLPGLSGAHQVDNYALAIAMLRHQQALSVPLAAIKAAATDARWPARMQLLGLGPVTEGRHGEVWLDGGHNPDAGEALAANFAASDTPVHLVIGMLADKDPRAIVRPLAERIASLSVVPVPGHESHPAAAFGPNARSFGDVATAIRSLPDDGVPVLVAGSLYLAGAVLEANREVPE
jgi:dihydrofolate synthase / folylpolyglutamate synthase